MANRTAYYEAETREEYISEIRANIGVHYEIVLKEEFGIGNINSLSMSHLMEVADFTSSPMYDYESRYW